MIFYFNGNQKSSEGAFNNATSAINSLLEIELNEDQLLKLCYILSMHIQFRVDMNTEDSNIRPTIKTLQRVARRFFENIGIDKISAPLRSGLSNVLSQAIQVPSCPEDVRKEMVMWLDQASSASEDELSS